MSPSQNGRRFEMLYLCPGESGRSIFHFLNIRHKNWWNRSSNFKKNFKIKIKTYSLFWSGSRLGWIADGTFVDVVCFSEIRPSRHGINYVDDWPIWQQALSRPSGRQTRKSKENLCLSWKWQNRSPRKLASYFSLDCLLAASFLKQKSHESFRHDKLLSGEIISTSDRRDAQQHVDGQTQKYAGEIIIYWTLSESLIVKVDKRSNAPVQIQSIQVYARGEIPKW